MLNYSTLAMLAVALLFGCTIDDEDRCPDGLFWDQDAGACHDGYLAPCDATEEDKNKDCQEYDADLCFYNQLDLEAPGMCVYQECTENGCPTDSQCCDCSLISFPDICLPDFLADDPSLASVCDCTP